MNGPTWGSLQTERQLVVGSVVELSAAIENAAISTAACLITPWIKGDAELLFRSLRLSTVADRAVAFGGSLDEPVPWLDDFKVWSRQANRALERRDDLVHRSVGMFVFGNRSEPYYVPSRIKHEPVPVGTQMNELERDLKALLSTGYDIFSAAHQWSQWVQSRADERTIDT